jgi:pimeloyl-ACP methyl ester carboxylesterase
LSRTLVLLHGVASNSTRWAEFAERTRLERWNILRPDLRGNGAAAFPRTRLGMDVWCADLAAALDAERCARAVIGGHCLGASIALHFAARYPKRVAALVLIEPMPPAALAGTARWLPALMPVLYTIYGAARALNACGMYRRRLEPLDLRAWDRATRSGERRLSMLASLGVDLRATPLAAYTRMLAATAEPWPEPAAISVPTLALISSRSSMTDPERTRRALAALPDCDVVELDAVHWIPTEQPDAMRTAIEDWLNRSALPAPPFGPRSPAGTPGARRAS